ncbi:MAG: cytochrome b N-terminal domain-containing protein [Nitrospirae bacterium]|nr:cytochrome b N-terminal domain-containing protein [Nitrospirota bacterium]
MIKLAWDWLKGKWPIEKIGHLLLDEELPGGAKFAYTLGSAIITVFTIQVISGIVQLFYYVPAADHAYDSVSYLRTRVPFGWLVHNLHYWGANAMVVLVVTHMIRVYIWAAYKTQLTWLLGVGLVLTTMAMTLTGGTLIWDQKGYWGGEVSSGVTSTVPVLGDLMKILLRGGEAMGQLSISRFFAIHIWLLPSVIVLLIAAHIISFRTSGIAGPWDEKKRKVTGLFWPDQAYKDAVTASLVVFILIALCVFAPPPFTGAADPLNTTYLPKPEWNFLFLYESLKYFEGPLEPVGTVGVPNVLIALLILLPFIDRGPERNPFKRPIAMACLVLYVGFLLTFTVKGYLSTGFAQLPPGVLSSLPVKPETAPPDASSSQSPAEKTSETEAAAGKMPGRAAFIIGGAENGAELFKQQCMSCHGADGKGGTPNLGSEDGTVPPLNPIDREIFAPDLQTFTITIDKFIQHGSVPEGPKPAFSMPAFGDTNSLTQEQISNIEAYVLKLNGVDRAQLIDPGMEPANFFIVVLVIYVIILLVQGGLRIRKNIS